jgi:transcriptional regulator with XRE-family HTH domain
MKTRDDKHARLYSFLGQRISELRQKSRLTQADLAAAVGLTRTSVTNIEKGRQRVPLHTFFDIAAALGTEASDLLPSKISFPSAEPKIPDTVSKRARAVVESVIRKAKVGG